MLLQSLPSPLINSNNYNSMIKSRLSKVSILMFTKAYFALILAFVGVTGAVPSSANDVLILSSNLPLKSSCDQIIANGAKNEDDRLLLCQLYESSTLLTQLGVLVNQGLDRLLTQRLISELPAQNWETVSEDEKKKPEYLKFGKRKHEYLRFGKRKHEYLRFG